MPECGILNCGSNNQADTLGFVAMVLKEWCIFVEGVDEIRKAQYRVRAKHQEHGRVCV